LASAEAERVTKVGLAQAKAIESQVAASGGPRFQLSRQIAERFAEALETSGVDVVPKVQIDGGAAGASGGLLQALMTLVMSEKLDLQLGIGAPEINPEAKETAEPVGE
jgi:uncharacterized membrane protein YqiK